MEQAGRLDEAMFESVVGRGQGGHFAALPTQDRPQADHRIVHREAELGGRERLALGEVVEDGEGARGFTMARDVHQRQRFVPLG